MVGVRVTPAAPARRLPASRPLLLPILLAAWLGIFHVLGRYTGGYGRLSFLMLTLVVSLLLCGGRLARFLPRTRGQQPIRIILGLLLVALLVNLGIGLAGELARPSGDRFAIDIAMNTYSAGTALLEGKNPYAEFAQVWHEVKPGPHVTVNQGEVRMYGVPYTYGFPYFPAMLLSYLPVRAVVPGYDSLRVTNAILLALNLAGIFWLARRLVLPALGTTAGLVAGVAYVGVSVLRTEVFRYAVTDLVIATYAVFAFLALSHRRWAVAGVLFGLAQACKLLPGPLLIAPALLWLWGRPGMLKLLIAYAATSVALTLPFVLPNPGLFLSSTVLFYLTAHAGGDDSSLWFTLPGALKPVFRTIGYLLTAGCVAWALRRRGDAVLTPLTLAFVAYTVFIAFGTMIHLNYMWGIYPLGCVALAVHASRAAAGPPEIGIREGETQWTPSTCSARRV